MTNPAMSWDLLFHAGDLSILTVIAWPVVKAANRITSVLKDFPPHRHEAGGVIRYPKGFEPGRTERLNGGERV